MRWTIACAGALSPVMYPAMPHIYGTPTPVVAATSILVFNEFGIEERLTDDRAQMIDIRSISIRTVGAITRRIGFPGSTRLTELVHSPQPGRGVGLVLETEDGLRVRVDTSNYIERRLFFDGAYEPEVARELRAHLSPKSTAIDVGANIGLHTLTMATAVQEGRVIACEPHPINRSKLRDNLSLNSLTNVIVSGTALGAESELVSLHSPDDTTNLGMASVLPLGDWPGIEVESTTIDALCKMEAADRVDLIKIDVEGLEGAVLAGAREVLERDRPVLVFEYGSDLWSRAGYDLRSVVQLLEEVGYKSFSIIDRGGLLPLAQERDGVNVLAK